MSRPIFLLAVSSVLTSPLFEQFGCVDVSPRCLSDHCRHLCQVSLSRRQEEGCHCFSSTKSTKGGEKVRYLPTMPDYSIKQIASSCRSCHGFMLHDFQQVDGPKKSQRLRNHDCSLHPPGQEHHRPQLQILTNWLLGKEHDLTVALTGIIFTHVNI